MFITGMLRSGTTLLENLINTHIPSRILYQPCMPLFTGVKNAFLESLGCKPERYPLGPLFLESRYDQDDFKTFLERYQPQAWPGLPDTPRGRGYPGSLAEMLPHLWRDLGCGAALSPLGAKEVLCEEYAPYLANRGFKVIIVLRDPRDVIASMNYGRASRFVGAVRPTLYNIRNWRKSVAFALHLNELGMAGYVRYEDLVGDPEKLLKNISSWLGLNRESFNMKRSLRDHHGKSWNGNSSFGDKRAVSTESVGKYRTILPQELVEYIQILCEPEMAVLGYQRDVLAGGDFERIVRSFREPMEISHPALPADYSENQENSKHEVLRYKLLSQRNCSSDAEAKQFFIFTQLHGLYRRNIHKCESELL